MSHPTDNKYTASHISPNGANDSRPTALQIIQDENLTGALKDITILITGCSSGIGVETARALSTTGATMYLTVRDLERGRAALTDILEPGRVEMLFMDLSSLSSVRQAAAEFKSKSKKLNVLICNAGVMAIPAPGTKTADGFETQFGTNHLGHFLLFNLLKDSLIESSKASFNSRVVMVSSSGHRGGGIRFGDYGFEKEPPYTPFGAYGQSKTANIYMANYIDRHFGVGRGEAPIHATSLMPGGIFTQLQKHVDEETKNRWRSPEVTKIMKSEAQGAATTVWAAVGQAWEGKGGRYLENCQESILIEEARPGPKGAGFVKHAFDEEKEDRLWRESLVMVGLENP